MKSLFYTTAICLFLYACTEPIQLNLDTEEPRLVIDADITITHPDEKTIDVVATVKLSLTTGFYDDSSKSPEVNDAKVSIKTIKNGSTTTQELPYQNNNSYYYLNMITIDADATYVLEIVYQSETYTSQPEKYLKTPRLSKIEVTTEKSPFAQLQNDDSNDGKNYLLKSVVYLDDNPNQENYYMTQLNLNNKLTYAIVSDEFYKKDDFAFAFNKSFDEGSSVLDYVGNEAKYQVYGISKMYYNFMTIVFSQSDNRNSGPPNSSSKSPIRGNIFNTTHEDKFPFGYFRIIDVIEAIKTVPNPEQ